QLLPLGDAGRNGYRHAVRPLHLPFAMAGRARLLRDLALAVALLASVAAQVDTGEDARLAGGLAGRAGLHRRAGRGGRAVAGGTGARRGEREDPLAAVVGLIQADLDLVVEVFAAV